MKVLAVIEWPAGGQSVAHLSLPTAAPRLRAPPDEPDSLEAVRSREWSWEPPFDGLPWP